jgi:hypothetical protein
MAKGNIAQDAGTRKDLSWREDCIWNVVLPAHYFTWHVSKCRAECLRGLWVPKWFSNAFAALAWIFSIASKGFQNACSDLEG